MAIALNHINLYSVLYKSANLPFQEKVNVILNYIEETYKNKIEKKEICKIENFVKTFDKKWKAVNYSNAKFKSKFADWLESSVQFSICLSTPGAPSKEYEDLGPKSKQKRLSTYLSTMSTDEVSDTFIAMLKKKDQPMEAVKIANVLPTASPKRLKRIVKSIPTPSSDSVFTEEEAIALMLQLELSRGKYIILRNALKGKGVNVLPSYDALQERKKNIIPAGIQISDRKAIVGISPLLENTASRIVSILSADQLEKINSSKLQLVCKWGCDGSSLLSEYKQFSESEISDYKSILMASMVPLRLRKYADKDSASTSFEDIWINPSPGSKSFCRPISFEYTKETKIATQQLVHTIESEIKLLQPISIEVENYSFNISFDMKLTMIDGKVCNSLTETSSNWNCSICGEKKTQFANISKNTKINEDVLKFGISPLHARIRFLEHFLHIAYDLKYRSITENVYKSVNKNEELKIMRAREKQRIQEEFKQQTGLNIDKPLVGYGSTNDGNTARRFFNNFETTSEITGLDKELLRQVNIILIAINSKHKINTDKFGDYCAEVSRKLLTLYPWKDMTPTVHKVLCHGKIIMENSILPLGELTEEPQESRNRDFKHVHQFGSRKCSRQSQNEDIFQTLILSSDPVLSHMRKQWICYRNLSFDCSHEFKDLMYLLDLGERDMDYFIELT